MAQNSIICAGVEGNSREQTCLPITYAAFPLDEPSVNTVSTFFVGYIHKITRNTKASIEANCNNLSFG